MKYSSVPGPARPAFVAHAIGATAIAIAAVIMVGVQPVAAQVVSPQACADIKEQIRYLVNEGAFIQDAGLKEGWTC